MSEDEIVTAKKRKMCKSDDEISSTIGRKSIKDDPTTFDASKEFKDEKSKEYAPVGDRKLKLKHAKPTVDSSGKNCAKLVIYI